MRTIASERVRLGLDQDQLAKRIGVHVNTVRLWESGDGKPGAENLTKLCQAFGCSADYLLGLTDERTIKP